MRLKWVMGWLVLMVANVRADVVVLQNTAAATDVSNTAGQGVDLTFTLSATARVSKVHLFRSAPANISVEVQRNGSAVGMPSDINVAAVSAGTDEYSYTLTNISAFDFTPGDNWLIRMTLGQSGFQASSAVSLDDPLGIFTTKSESGLQVSGGGTGYVRFQMYGSAVPEPGTMLLGGFAAMAGGAGVWWKRRRNRAAHEKSGGIMPA